MLLVQCKLLLRKYSIVTLHTSYLYGGLFNITTLLLIAKKLQVIRMVLAATCIPCPHLEGLLVCNKDDVDFVVKRCGDTETLLVSVPVQAPDGL